jgi:hypothetical protein
MGLGSGIQDPGSGKNLFRIPDPRSRDQKGTGSRIPDPDPQHWWWVTVSSSHPSTRVSRYTRFNPNIMTNVVEGDRVILTPVNAGQQVYIV